MSRDPHPGIPKLECCLLYCFLGIRFFAFVHFYSYQIDFSHLSLTILPYLSLALPPSLFGVSCTPPAPIPPPSCPHPTLILPSFFPPKARDRAVSAAWATANAHDVEKNRRRASASRIAAEWRSHRVRWHSRELTQSQSVTPLTAGEAAIKIQCFWLRWRCALVCKQLGMVMVGHKVRRKEERGGQDGGEKRGKE